ncbi:MAG: hypothetical protein P1U44_10775 [Vicingaceae bacterium]|nr:hypothetical protein [Vicingaceae bacterium]
MILDLNKKTLSKKIPLKEKDLQRLIIDNFELIFPKYRLLESEFILQGDVRQFGVSGRIDILAFDSKQNRLVIFELKTTHSKNILIQALDYLDFLEVNEKSILYRIKNLSRFEIENLLNKGNKPEIVLIAETFTHPTLRRVDKLNQPIKLLEYSAFENNLFHFNNIVDDNKSQKPIDFKVKQKGNLNFNEIESIVKELFELGLVSSNYYKIESGALIFNPTNVYNAYVQFSLDNNQVPFSKTDFFEGLKRSGSYLGKISSVRFDNKRTSAIKLKV